MAFNEKVDVTTGGSTVQIESNQVFGMGKQIITPTTPAPGGAHHRLTGTFTTETGQLYIDWYSTTQSGRGIGKEMISRAIEKIGPNQVKSIAGELGADNLRTFQRLVKDGLSTQDAVWGTALGKTAKGLGYTKLSFDEITKVATFSR